MVYPALDGGGQFPWNKLICDEYELVAHLLDSIRAGEFRVRCVRCRLWCVTVEDGICDVCWEQVQQAIE